MSTPRNYPKKQQKINNTTKLEFIYQVMALKRTVKEAAEELKINYSTAKSIIRLYKTDHLRIRGSLQQAKDEILQEQSSSTTHPQRISGFRQATMKRPMGFIPPTKAIKVEYDPMMEEDYRSFLVGCTGIPRLSYVEVISGETDLFY